MHDLDIIKINECLVAKNLLTNVTKTNEHSNVATFVRALEYMCCYLSLSDEFPFIQSNNQPTSQLITFTRESSPEK